MERRLPLLEPISHRLCNPSLARAWLAVGVRLQGQPEADGAGQAGPGAAALEHSQVCAAAGVVDGGKHAGVC